MQIDWSSTGIKPFLYFIHQLSEKFIDIQGVKLLLALSIFSSTSNALKCILFL